VRGRILSLLALINGVRLNLSNVYAPTNLTDRKVFFENLHEFSLPADVFAIGGDFNCYERASDKFGGNISLAHYLSDFRSALSLVDIWSKIHPRTHEFTWFNSDFAIGSCLDKFLISRNPVPSVNSCEISTCVFFGS